MEAGASADRQAAADRNDAISEALKELEPHDIDLRCRECGDYFTFSIGEQQFYKRKGFVHLKRCPACREKKEMD